MMNRLQPNLQLPNPTLSPVVKNKAWGNTFSANKGDLYDVEAIFESKSHLNTQIEP